MSNADFDWVIVGSGFGGSVSALRLAERGYRVLVLEKGKRFTQSDFAKNNWDLRRWMWMPRAGLAGIFQMSFFKHVTILHGVGVGGGSLTYANTLPTPGRAFFEGGNWAGLADWEAELEPHYRTARRMLGSATNPEVTRGDEILRDIARDMGREEHFHPTDVGVFFGEPGRTVKDPYFDGRGPDRTGCTHCGACMTGCRVGAKNTLDRNYLHLAERLGAEVRAESEVVGVHPRPGGGYALRVAQSLGPRSDASTITADKVIFAGGVMGTVPLLLQMKEKQDGLPKLSDRLGRSVRTNSEALCGIVCPDPNVDLTRGVAITSILHTDDYSHIEPVRYGPGSGFFRTMVLPSTSGATTAGRMVGVARSFVSSPGKWLRALTVKDFSRQSQTLLYMRTTEGTLTMRLGRDVYTGFGRGLVTELDETNSAPSAFMDEATDLAERFAKKLGAVRMSLLTETLLGVPSTAHILGGCCMGAGAADGVIDRDHRVFGYDGLYVVDGSAVSANPGVNPSLTITAMAERMMANIPNKA